jgi:hypothetical protein
MRNRAQHEPPGALTDSDASLGAMHQAARPQFLSSSCLGRRRLLPDRRRCAKLRDVDEGADAAIHATCAPSRRNRVSQAFGRGMFDRPLLVGWPAVAVPRLPCAQASSAAARADTGSLGCRFRSQIGGIEGPPTCPTGLQRKLPAREVHYVQQSRCLVVEGAGRPPARLLARPHRLRTCADRPRAWLSRTEIRHLGQALGRENAQCGWGSKLSGSRAGKFGLARRDTSRGTTQPERVHVRPYGNDLPSASGSDLPMKKLHDHSRSPSTHIHLRSPAGTGDGRRRPPSAERRTRWMGAC